MRQESVSRILVRTIRWIILRKKDMNTDFTPEKRRKLLCMIFSGSLPPLRQPSPVGGGSVYDASLLHKKINTFYLPGIWRNP
jgi:hypothetical protein